MKISVREKACEAKEFKHVTEAERKAAQDLWNKFNDDLAGKGLRLMYDYTGGGFFVCSSELVGEYKGSAAGLSNDELDAVIREGGFDQGAKNNPPWFVDGSDYILAVKAK